MTERRWWRMAALILVAVVAGLFAAFNTGERVALNLGFTMLYRVPLVPLIFLVFMAGMTTMFLVGLRHDARVRRALHDARLGREGSSDSHEGEYDSASSRRRRPDPPVGGVEATSHDLDAAPATDEQPPVGRSIPATGEQSSGGDARPPMRAERPVDAPDPWVRDHSAASNVGEDDPSATWAETGAVGPPPEPLPPDQETRDPP